MNFVMKQLPDSACIFKSPITIDDERRIFVRIKSLVLNQRLMEIMRGNRRTSASVQDNETCRVVIGHLLEFQISLVSDGKPCSVFDRTGLVSDHRVHAMSQ